MIVSAPAKINLTLRILGKRSDGYHALESILQMLTLADTLVLDSANSIQFTCSAPELNREDNLVVQAARLLNERSHVKRGARIHLQKKIPVEAGLGGGSSDAAAAIAALNEFWEIRLPQDELVKLASQLGSDVPFFLGSPTAVARGRGEDVRPVPNHMLGHIVLAKPASGLSTAEVYRNLHARHLAANNSATTLLPETQAMLHALQQGNLDGVANAMSNALEGPALQMLPELIPLRERMLEKGCLAVLLCGSGSTLFGLCPDADTAKIIALELTNDFSWTWAGPWLLFK